MKAIYLIALLALTASAATTARAEVTTLDLDGRWTLRRAGEDEAIPATVPGVVHLDLRAAGKIPDPFYGKNEEGALPLKVVGEFGPAQKVALTWKLTDLSGKTIKQGKSVVSAKAGTISTNGPTPDLSTELKQAGGSAAAMLWVDAKADDGTASPVTIRVTPSQPTDADAVKQALVARSLYDTYEHAADASAAAK